MADRQLSSAILRQRLRMAWPVTSEELIEVLIEPSKYALRSFSEVGHTLKTPLNKGFLAFFLGYN